MRLAISAHPMLPSASPYGVGVPEQCIFAAEYPARTFPCQRFKPPSRAAPHDSEPAWFAKPSLYETFIHYTSPVFTGAQGETL